MLNNFYNLPNLNKNSPISTQSRNWKDFCSFLEGIKIGQFAFDLFKSSTYVSFLPGVVCPSYVPTT